MITKRRLAAFGAILTIVAVIIGVTAGSVSAVHDIGLFQLDYVLSPTAQGAANVSHTNITPAGNTGDDWDQVYAGTSSAFADLFVPDPTQAADHSYFSGGGSKDVNDIPQWQYGQGVNTTPNKDDLNDIFAAAYKPTSGSHAGHTLFYFGADRFDNSGDSQLGFWFFRSQVSLGPNGAFTGQHSVGDILVVSDFVNGGQAGDVTVYKWVGGQNPLQLLLDQTHADCSVAVANDIVCAVINNIDGETPPWPYTNDLGLHSYSGSGQPNSNGKGLLLEGGLDVNDLLAVPDIGCFSSFLGETRSSHSTSAQLKDFALGNFAVCGISVTKTGDTLGKVSDPAHYTITIQNTGEATLYKRDISDTLLGAITTGGVNQANPYVDTNTCGASLAAGATCTITLHRTVLAGDPDPLPNTVTIIYSEHSDFTGAQFTSSASHSVNLFQPAVSIAKTGDALSKIGDSVTYNFTITNMSSQDSPNLQLASISDNVLGDLSSQATAAGCDVLTYQEVCSFSVSRTVQAGDSDPLINTVNVLYHPIGWPNNITASDMHSVNLFQPAVSIDKTGDALSKIGDSVTYHFKITNTSSNDSPSLILDTISDDVLGNLASYATAASCGTLAPGASCQFNVPWTVLAGYGDPVINTVTIHFHPSGFTNDITATASHELNLFQPSISFAKTADTQLSKATDVVNYTLTLNNTSSTDTPDMVCTVSDPQLGVNKQVTLASGGGDVTNIAYTVQAGDPDPLVNTASVSCSPTGFPNVLTASSGWTVNLFQPSVTVEKSGPPLSKVGDPVTYHFKVTNTSSADSPNLVRDSISDNVVPNIVPPVTCDNLAPGASCQFDVAWTVLDGYGDPVVNTVTVHYHPLGFTNDITASASHSLNLFQPSLTFSKSADTQLSKIGDVVNYTLTLNNTSSADSPALACTVTDPLLGVNKSVTLASGATDTTQVAYTVKTGDPDPLINNASVTCSPTGFPNVLTGSGTWTVNLFQPSVKITKTGPAFSKATDTATYNVTIQNTSSADTPNLVWASFTDSVVAGVTPPAACNNLASGTSCTFSYTYVVQAGDPDPLVNTATVHYNPTGFTNDISSSSSWTTDLVHPSFTATKVCKANTEPIPQAGPAVFTITVNNTGDADLHVVPSEGAAFDVAAGTSHSYDYSVAGPFSATVNNTVTGMVTLASKYNLSNQYTFTANGSCIVEAKAKVIKTVNGQPPSGTQQFTFQLRSGASPSSDGTILEQVDANAGNGGVINFTTQLVPGQHYQLCEWVLPGWNTSLGPNLFVPNSIIPPALPNPNVNNVTVCTDFVAQAGQTATFTVDNTPPPGGRALTIGFWKNWASCSGSNGKGQKPMLDQTLSVASSITTNPPGGLVVSAQNPGGGWPNFAATYYLVLKGDPSNPNAAPDCLNAVNLLNKSTLTGKKMASDPLFNMAAQLVGAQLNYFAGAGKNGTTTINIQRAVLLLGKYSFNGNTYSPKLSSADTSTANCLATQLDNYNNDRPVSTCP